MTRTDPQPSLSAAEGETPGGGALRAEESRYRALFELMPEGIAFCRMIFEDGQPSDWVYLEVNAAFSDLTGLRDVVGKRLSEVLPQLREHHPEILALKGRVVRTGVPERIETFIAPMRSWLAISVLRTAEDCFVALFEDITARMRAEEALRQSESFARSTFDSLASQIAVVDGDGTILSVNESWRRFAAANGGSLGSACCEGANYLAVCDRAAGHGSAEAGRLAQGLRAVLARESESFELEYACHAPHCERWFVVRITAACAETGRAVVAHENVTHRVLGERATREGLERSTSILESSPDAMFVYRDDRFVTFNQKAMRLFGAHEKSQLEGRSPLEFIVPDGLEATRRRIERMRETGLPAPLVEQRIVRLDGKVVPVEVASAPFTEQGRLSFHVTMRDISERKAAEAALVEERSRLRTVLDTIPDKVWLKDPQGVYLACNPAFERMVGARQSDLVGKTDDDFYPREVAEAFRGHDSAAIAAGRPTTNEEWLDSAEAGRILIETIKTPVRDPEGRLLGALGIARDVTAARAVEESLRQSEEHYRALAETTFDWIWEIDAAARYIFVGPRVEQLLGYAPGEVIGRTPFSLMPAAEAERVRELFSGFSARRAPFANLENVNRHKDGSLVVLESSGVPFFGSDGELRGYRGMDRDITARKQAERRSATQAAVSRVLAMSSSLVEAAPGLLRAIGEPEGWSFGALWECDPSASALACVAWWAAANVDAAALGEATCHLRLRRGEGFPGATWAAGGLRCVSDLPSDLSFQRRDEAAALRLQGAVGFPIRLGDEILGVVEFLGTRMSEPDAALREVFESVGRQIGLFVERRRSEATVRRFVSGSPAVIYALRVEPERQRLIWYSDNFAVMTGWQAMPEDVGRWWAENVHPEDLPAVLESFPSPYERDHLVLEFRFRRQDGRYLWVRDERRLLRDAAGRPTEIVGSWTNVTERVELEEKLRVAQKLEAIGRLAGGVAHDFNNMLMVISGNGEMLDRALPAEGSERALLGEIREAAERSASLTRQLLAFSRTQVLAPRVHSLAEVVSGIETMLRRLIGEDVALVCELDAAAGHVLVDRGQLEQVIVNLAVNARDAMPRGGTLTVRTSAIDLDESSWRRIAGLAPGSFARLEVRDTGCGMRPEVLEKIFEPFFTTKPVGKGTGLGLSTVFGIVKQSGGHIEATSTEGEGSSFIIYFPRVPAPARSPEHPEAGAGGVPARAALGRETVLVVEDEPGVRRVVRLALEKQGYKLLVACCGREAVALAEQYPEPIDLLLTDLVMPEMSGSELAGILRARRPGLAVLLMSGYVEDDFVRHGVVSEEVAFLHKPFTLAELTGKVRETLAAAST